MTDAAVQEMFGSFGAFTLSFRGERLFCVTSTDRVWIMSALISDGAVGGFQDDETAMQLHIPPSDYVCLQLQPMTASISISFI